MEMRLEHIGIAVWDLNSVAKKFRELLGELKIDIQNYQRDGIHYRIAFVTLGVVKLELIEPVSQNGMAWEHLKEFGPGVYHFALQVSSLDKIIEEYRIKGFEVQHIRTGVCGQRICFLETPIFPGIYLEFVE